MEENPPADMRGADVLAERVLEAVKGRRDELLDLIRRLVALETPSLEPESQPPALAMIREAVESLGYRCRRIPGCHLGDQVLAVPSARRRRRPLQVLIGHCDTVWPTGTLREMPLRADGSHLHGPGIYDMKTGLAQAVFALRVLHDLGLEPSVTPLLFVNSDEEVGSKDSARTIERLARIVDRAFVLEPSLGPEGRLKTARKGVVQYRIVVRGRAAHAGLDPEKGVSAILEMSYLIQRLFDLNDVDRGVTVNVGLVDGGLRPNVIAPESRATVDVRVPTQEDAARVDAAIRALGPTRADAAIEVESAEGRPPMVPGPGCRRLWAAAQRHATALGIELDEGTAGGGSDGNITNQFAPTLDGLGAVGGGAHAIHEHVDVERIPERTSLLALLLMEPPLEP